MAHFFTLRILCLRLDCDIIDCTWLLAVLCEVGNKYCKYIIVRNLNKLATKKLCQKLSMYFVFQILTHILIGQIYSN